MISVIMPTKNQEKYIAKAIETILCQTLQDFELIIIDNQSEDFTSKIIKEYQKTDDRIRLYTSDGFAGKARNLGISKASGDRICFVDSDDFFNQHMLEMLNDAMNRTNADIVISKAYRYNDISNTSKIMDYLASPPNELYATPLSPINDMSRILFQTTVPCPWAKLFSKRLIDTSHIQFQDLHNANDILFVYGCICNSSLVTYIPEASVFYRTHIVSRCQGTKDLHPTDCISAYYALYKYLQSINKYNVFKKSFIQLVITGLKWNYSSLHLAQSKELLKREYYTSELYDVLRVEEGEEYDCII